MAPGAESATRLRGLVVGAKRLGLRHGVKAAVRMPLGLPLRVLSSGLPRGGS